MSLPLPYSLVSSQVSNKKFCNLGLNPITVEFGLMDEVVNIAQKYQDRCDRTKVLPSSFWNKARADAAATDKNRY
jgi:UDP-sulfoquinovose synthase